MAMPLTVKQYKIREYLAARLDADALNFDEFLNAIGVELPAERFDANGDVTEASEKTRNAEAESWSEAVRRVRNKLLSS